jgi:hypothetical protein
MRAEGVIFLMRCFRRSALYVALLVVIATVAGATTPIVDCRPNCWGKEGLEIQAALAIADPEESRAAAREAVRRGLFGAKEARKNVIGFLESQMRWVPVEDYADILIEASDAGLCDCRVVLDNAHLLRSPREYRIAICGEAITQGDVMLAYGSSMPAYAAISLAATDGLSELRALIESNIEIAGTDAEFFLEMLELTGGGVDREDAAAKAVTRLKAMPPQQMYEKMEGKPSFRRAVLRIASYSCVAGDDPRCLDLLEVSKQQQALAAELKSGEAIEMPDPADWSYQLREIT